MFRKEKKKKDEKVGKQSFFSKKKSVQEKKNENEIIMKALEQNPDIKAETLKFFGLLELIDMKLLNRKWSGEKMIDHLINKKISKLEPQREDLKNVLNQRHFKDKFIEISLAIDEQNLPFMWNKNNNEFNKKLSTTIIKMLNKGKQTLQERDQLESNEYQKPPISKEKINTTKENLKKCLFRADFSGEDLSKSELHGARMPNSNLTETILTNADLSDADLSYSNMTYANITNANVKGADMTGTNLKGVKITFEQIMSLKSCANAQIDFHLNKFSKNEMEAINNKVNPSEIIEEKRHKAKK